jgi:hypothetical protein
MLIYHPVYDTNHGMFRLLRLLEANPDRQLKWDTYRILDLYYLFPHLLEDVRFPRAMMKWKRAFITSGSKYTRVPSPRSFIQQLEGIHESVARSLAAKGFIEPAEFDEKLLVRTEREIPSELAESMAGASQDQKLVEMLAIEMAAIPLSGTGGLKERTGLLEHRYDAV